MKRRRRSTTLLFALALALAAGGVAAWCASQAGGRADAVGENYGLSYRQISMGAAASRSSEYAVESTLGLGADTHPDQRSANYSIVNPLDFEPQANNALAIGIGTTMHLDWSGVPAPPEAQGYDVYRSDTAVAGTFEKVNPATVTAKTYEDENLAPGSYFYIVYYVNDRGQGIPLTPVFYGVIQEVPASAGAHWLLL